MCKFTLCDAERVSKINTQIAQLTLAANYLAVTNRECTKSYSCDIDHSVDINIWKIDIGTIASFSYPGT